MSRITNVKDTIKKYSILARIFWPQERIQGQKMDW